MSELFGFDDAHHALARAQDSGGAVELVEMLAIAGDVASEIVRRDLEAVIGCGDLSPALGRLRAYFAEPGAEVAVGLRVTHRAHSAWIADPGAAAVRATLSAQWPEGASQAIELEAAAVGLATGGARRERLTLRPDAPQAVVELALEGTPSALMVETVAAPKGVEAVFTSYRVIMGGAA